jgi:hypothetical protein
MVVRGGGFSVRRPRPQAHVRARYARTTVLLLAVIGTAACSYIFELPGTAAFPTDPDGSDDGAADALIDLGPIPEAASPPPPFCPSRTTPFLYCEDFDGMPAPDLATIGAVQAVGGQVVLASAVAQSPPRSLLATLRGPNAAGAVTHALGQIPDAGPSDDGGTNPEGVSFAFEQLTSIWETADARLAAIVIENGTAKCTVGLGGTQTTWTFTQVCEDNGAETARVTTDTMSPVVRGRWQRFAIAIAFTPTVTVAVDVDGVRSSIPGVAPLQRGTTSIVLGAPSVPAGNVTVFQDNVLVTSP